ncbi:MAG: DUF1501 domain-containing protein [Planctomycetaceae bacterium]|nr:DUF1501 domain-containing protein [Planctomycetaceae bacterium]
MSDRDVRDRQSDCFETTRRRFIETLAKSALGVSILPYSETLFAATATPVAAPAKKAEHVIYLFMNGAMSHIDTFDPKPGTESGGETKAIQTAVSGIAIGHHLPQLAKQMNRLAVIRSMTTETAAHQQAVYLMRTSYKEIGSIRHPFMGAWLAEVDGRQNKDLPGSVIIGSANRHPGQGYLSAEVAPAPVADPKSGLQNIKPPKYLDERSFSKRQRLINRFESDFRTKYATTEVNAYRDFYREAVKLLQSPDLEAFDISREDQKIRDAYGDHRIGQGCLLARRLIEKRVRFVEVEFGGWDNHNDIYSDTNLVQKAAQLDQAVSSLLEDLSQRKMLDKTLVVIGTEFGRTPKINQNAGRDHHPAAFSCMLAGAGIRGGQVIGQTDSEGRNVDTGHCYPQDLNATIAYACGLPVEKEFHSPNGRPFHIANEGKPITDLFS